MIKFFIISALAHVFVFSFLVFRKDVIIEDPVLSVEIDSSTMPSSASSRKKNTSSKTSVQNLKPASQDNIQDNKNTEESTSSEDSLGASSALDSQLVTIKPRVLHQEKVDYPLEAETARIEGAVKLSIVVNTQGQVVEVRILEGPGYGLNEAAANALKRFRFSAAEKEGEKVSVRLTYIYRFRLDSR